MTERNRKEDSLFSFLFFFLNREEEEQKNEKSKRWPKKILRSKIRSWSEVWFWAHGRRTHEKINNWKNDEKERAGKTSKTNRNRNKQNWRRKIRSKRGHNTIWHAGSHLGLWSGLPESSLAGPSVGESGRHRGFLKNKPTHFGLKTVLISQVEE